MDSLYVEAQNSVLVVGVLRGSDIVLKKHYSFNYGEVCDGVLFNPTRIFLCIKKYIKEQDVKLKTVVVCAPILSKLSEFKQKIFTFQLVLCVSKVGLKIQGVSVSKYLNGGQLDFFKDFRHPRNNKPHSWLGFTGLVLTILISTLCVVTRKETTHCDELRKQHDILLCKSDDLAKKVKIVKNIQKDTEVISKKVKKCLSRIKNVSNYKTLLSVISQNIPDNTVISNLIVKDDRRNKRKDINAKYKLLEIDGISLNEKELAQFCKDLSKAPMIKQIAFEHIEAIEGGSSYKFRLIGQL
jgi:hypothetical protein